MSDIYDTEAPVELCRVVENHRDRRRVVVSGISHSGAAHFIVAKLEELRAEFNAQSDSTDFQRWRADNDLPFYMIIADTSNEAHRIAAQREVKLATQKASLARFVGDDELAAEYDEQLCNLLEYLRAN